MPEEIQGSGNYWTQNMSLFSNIVVSRAVKQFCLFFEGTRNCRFWNLDRQTICWRNSAEETASVEANGWLTLWSRPKCALPFSQPGLYTSWNLCWIGPVDIHSRLATRMPQWHRRQNCCHTMTVVWVQSPTWGLFCAPCACSAVPYPLLISLQPIYHMMTWSTPLRFFLPLTFTWGSL